MHQDSDRVPTGITRTKEEALALAKRIAINAQSDGADFAELAKEHSDGPSGPDGGNLGNFLPDKMVSAFSNATLELAIGEVSDPVETQFGYHIIRRQELQIIPKASAKHILVMHTESMRAAPSITRTKEEAKTRIQVCLTRYREGENFEDLAREYSDGPSAPSGGDLGEFPQGVMAPAFEKATFACEVGKITDVVETPFGYHIIYRYK
jgi:parvulin-like peptidyl-prolyl isomerase